MMRIVALAITAATATTASLLAQTSAEQKFEVVSIKPHLPEPGPLGNTSTINQRLDGGMTMTNVAAVALIARAYPSLSRSDIIGLPEWATSERYDVTATSPLARATAEDRIAMMRAMLADRFKLVSHVEQPERATYDLILAREDGGLGPGHARSINDCASRFDEQRDLVEWGVLIGPPPGFDPRGPLPPCRFGLTSVYPDRLEGEATMPVLALRLREPAGRPVLDKTGLMGTYRVNVRYHRWVMGGTRLTAPNVVSDPNAVPVIFTAIREQLGLKLESSTAQRDTLIIDRLERPTEN